MNEIQAAILDLLPPKRKTTPSSWISFNAVCCHHQGQSKDNRTRGGLLINNDGGWQYNCFNCNFKAGWSPGKLLSSNTKKLCRWLGLDETDIAKLSLIALKLKDDQPTKKIKFNLDLEEKNLPDDCQSIDQWIAQGCQDPDLVAVISYLVDQRRIDWSWYPWHWSKAEGYKDRVILPFYHQGKIIGWTGRKIKPGKPKYLTDTQPSYVFNIDQQTDDKKYCIVVEGQFDAIAIQGCAIMHNNIHDGQAMRLNALDREIIVVPDRDQAGVSLIDSAIKHKWSVSFPHWEKDVKDVADAVARYGRLYTLYSILYYKETNEVKIQLLKKKLENYVKN